LLIMQTDALTQHLAQMRLRNLSPRTIHERSNALERLARHLTIDSSDLAAVMPADLDRWQREISHMSPRYRASWHSHARTFFRWAVENGFIISDRIARPCRRAAAPVNPAPDS